MYDYYNVTNDGKLTNKNGKESFSDVYGEIDLSLIDELSTKELKEVKNELQKKNNRLIAKKEKPSSLYLITFASTAIIHIINTILFGTSPNTVVSFIPETVSFPNAVSLGIISICLPTSIIMHFLINKKNKKIDLEIKNVNNDLNRVKYKLSEQAKNKKYALKYGSGRKDIVSNSVENTINKLLEFRR